VLARLQAQVGPAGGIRAGAGVIELSAHQENAVMSGEPLQLLQKCHRLIRVLQHFGGDEEVEWAIPVQFPGAVGLGELGGPVGLIAPGLPSLVPEEAHQETHA